MSSTAKWKLTGDYFENCNCSVVCPCLVSTAPPMTSRPTEGDCHVALAIHIDKGSYGDVKLDGLNAAVIAKSDGPMGNGNMVGAIYIDERADDRQAEALSGIFGGAEGGPMAGFAPLFGRMLGVKKVPISYKIDGKTRSASIPGVLSQSAKPLPSLAEGEVIWAAIGHPFAPEKLALAMAGGPSSFTDHGISWSNFGKNAHFAPISWSN